MRRRLVMLLSSAGRRVELLRCFRAAAEGLGLDLEVLASDLNPAWSAACQEADAAFAMPRCGAPEFIERMRALCGERQVDLLVPTIDTELQVLSDHGEALRAAGTEVAISAPGVVGLARDKLRTAEFLQAAGIPTPRTATIEAVLAAPGGWTWPLLVKPRGGSSSLGIQIVESPEVLSAAGPLPGHIVQERLEGAEYTVNLFFDRKGRLVCAVPHRRCEVRAGEVSKGVTRRQGALLSIARKLGELLEGDARGALCFQGMVDGGGRARVFEINARFGGGYPLAHRAGARFADWLLEEALGLAPSCHDDWEEGVVMLRYDAAVFRREDA